MKLELIQFPEPGRHILKCCGDTITFRLTANGPISGRAFISTNIGTPAIQRQEIILQAERRMSPIGQDWNSLPMQQVNDFTFEITLGLSDEGHFEAKCGIINEDGLTEWVNGRNIHLNVMPAAYCSCNTVYCVFVRQFCDEMTRAHSCLPEGVTQEQLDYLDQMGYSVIPASGTFRRLTRHLDHIINTLKCRIIHLLPITPTPTTYARMGRFGSPYASQDFTAIDPALAEFDRAASPLEQFHEFVEAVHGRNARVFLDIAINHTGWASKLQEEHPDWFVRKEDGTYVSPGAWGVTWGDLIEMNHVNPALWNYLAGIFLVWCQRGVDGFRCDAGYMIPVNAWQYIIAKVRNEYPETIFLLEGLGGAVETTSTLLDIANMDWAYSELFQNYTGDQIRGYLNYAWNESSSNGLMVHYAETHDNSRLAANGPVYAKMRTALCALASSCGAFGFTAGVEWFATEKIDVHGNNALNWGADPNQVQWISRLNTILGIHPAFFNGAFLDCLQTDSPDSVVIARSDRTSRHHLLIVVNLNCVKSTAVVWDSSYAPFDADKVFDLLSGSRFSLFRMRDHKVSMTLPPGHVVCLAPDNSWLPKIDEAENGSILAVSRNLEEQQAAAMVLRALVAMRGSSVLFADDDIPSMAKMLLKHPESLLLKILNQHSEIPYTIFLLPVDLKREVMIPPKFNLLVVSPKWFRFMICDQDHTVASVSSIHDSQGRFFALLPQLPVPAEHKEYTVKVFSLEDGHVRREQSVILQLAEDISQVQVSLSRDELFHRDRVYLQTNGRGAMSRLCLYLDHLSSRYDGILLANLDPEIPVDRHVMWRHFRFGMIYRARRQEITGELIESFHVTPDNSAVWTFHVPVGNARIVGLALKIKLLYGENAVRMTFYRTAYTESGHNINDTEPVTIWVSPLLEDRSFHQETRAVYGPQDSFPKAVSEVSKGFSFRPANDRILTILASSGLFFRSDKWFYMYYQEKEAERGLYPNTDLYSPGCFMFQLTSDDKVYLIGQIRTDENTHLIHPYPDTPPDFSCADNDIESTLKKSLSQFIVKRGNLKTVIAGYPWFLDWGRDTLIVSRGLIADPCFHDDVRKIILQFASLAKDGTICNMISGSDTGNRDTSDAPLWLFIAARDMCKALGSTDFLSSEVRPGTTLLDVLLSLAQDLMKGTPNGIRFDSESGLLFSPAHFTWMDTNYPAGTPREGYPVEIQALWFASLSFLGKILPEDQAAPWIALAAKVRKSVCDLFYLKDEGFLSDCLHCTSGTPASAAVADDHLRPNQLYAITLGLIDDFETRKEILLETSMLLIPGAIRSLADRPVEYKLPVYGHDGRLLNNPANPYWGHYQGDEDTSRKPAYHNGTAWAFMMPLYPEAYWMTYGSFGKSVATSILSSMALALNNNCIQQVVEIMDGDYPHKARGCDAQAWSISEYFRVWKLLHPASKGDKSAS